MPATVLIREKNGAGETPTDKTSGTIRFKNADDANVNTSDPLVVPGSGQEYSYEKWLQLSFSVAPDTEITDLECYLDGSNDYGTGVKLWYRILGSFSTPGIPTEGNDPPEFPVNGTPSAGADAFGLTTGAPGDLGAGPHTGTGDKGDYLVLVMEVEPTATQGALSAETLTFRYDEI